MSGVTHYARASRAAAELAAWTLTEEFKTLGVEALPALALMALDFNAEANAAAARARAHRALRRLLREQLAAGFSVERAPS
jgi:hypothetical protein